MKLTWLKDILGDAYTEEADAQVCKALGERFVSRADYNAKNERVKELETENGQLQKTVESRDTQLEDLRKSAGDNADLQKQIDMLTEQNKQDRAAHEKEMTAVRLTAAADAELTAAGSRNNIAVKALLADFLGNAEILDGKVVSKEDGASVTLASKLEAMKKDKTTDFLFGATAKVNGWKPGEGGDGGAPAGGKTPAKMTYAELSEYLAANPDAKLD